MTPEAKTALRDLGGLTIYPKTRPEYTCPAYVACAWAVEQKSKNRQGGTP